MQTINRLAVTVRREGLLGLAKLVQKNLLFHYRLWMDQRFDRRYGTDTCGRIELSQLTVLSENREHGVYFESTPTAIFRFFLENLRIEFERFTFVDLGSGKGRTLMLASDWPFKCIQGVEFSLELHECATRNLSIYRSGSQRCHSIESVHADATQFDWPNTPLLVYAYNPFDEAVMTAVLRNLADSLKRAPRAAVLVYYNPRWQVMEKFPALPLRARLAVPYDPTREVQRPAAIYSNFTLPHGSGWLTQAG